MTVVEFPMPKHRVPTMDEWTKIWEAFNAIRPTEGLGIMINDAAQGGAQINATASGGLGGTSLHPLDVVNAIDEDGDPAIRIVYGTVEGLSDPFNPGDNPIYTLPVPASNRVFIQLNVTYDSGSGVWTSNSLTFGYASSVPAATSTEAYLEIGSTDAQGNAASATVGSIGHVRCGDGVVWGDQWWSV